jgi:hypothetical protein
MMRYCIFILMLIFSLPVTAGDHWRPAGSRAAALGSASVSLADYWSVNNNQAGMAFYNKPSAGFYYENGFLIKELGYQSVALTVPTRYGVFGSSVSYSGDANYNEAIAGLAYAKSFGNRFSAGIRLDYLHTGLTAEYGASNIVTFEAGILAKLTNDLTFGAHVFNPLNAKLTGFYDEKIPAVMRAGVSYSFSDALLFTTEVFKNSQKPVQFLAGTEYRFFRKGYARIGIATNPFKYTFGFGLEIKNFTFDISSSVHEVLGYSPQVSLQYAFR